MIQAEGHIPTVSSTPENALAAANLELEATREKLASAEALAKKKDDEINGEKSKSTMLVNKLRSATSNFCGEN